MAVAMGFGLLDRVTRHTWPWLGYGLLYRVTRYTWLWLGCGLLDRVTADIHGRC